MTSPQLPSTGVDALAGLPASYADHLLPLWTSAKGAHFQPVTEHAITRTLTLPRVLLDRNRARSWPRSPKTGTRRMFSIAGFVVMRRSSVLVNIARGDLVDSDALVAAPATGEITGAGLNLPVLSRCSTAICCGRCRTRSSPGTGRIRLR